MGGQPFRGIGSVRAGPQTSPDRQSHDDERKWLFGVAALALIGIAVLARGLWTADGAPRARNRAARVVPVEVAKAVRKQVPVRVDALGTVTPIASVAIKARVDTTIIGVHFRDGAEVKKGDLLFTLDGRAIEAQIAQTEGAIARDRAQLAGAERDVARYTDLVAKGATPIINLDNAKTQAERLSRRHQGRRRACSKISRSSSAIAPSARRSPGASARPAVKVGNFVRQADTAPMATINQMAPVYVSFTVPQKELPEVRAGAGRRKPPPSRRPSRARRKHATGQVTHDREHGRSRDRHGDHPRHHAEQGRSAVAGHAGDRRI